MKARPALLLPFALLLALAAAYFFLLRPTRLPLRLLEICAPPEGRTVHPYAPVGDETRSAFTLRASWRCEVPLTPDPDAVLSLALGPADHAGPAALGVRFEPLLGGARILREGAVADPGDGDGWTDLRVPMASAGRLRGRLVLELAGSGGDRPLHLAEPVLFRPRPRPERNLILVLIDTLRADRVGYAGYARPTTPRLDALSAEGVRYENAYAPTSWTRPSTATILTGLEPLEHQVHTRRDRLSPRLTTLAERLRGAGYATTAFSSNPNVLPYWGFHQGFERFVDVDAGRWTHNDDVGRMIDLALAELERVRDRPFFLYLHVNQVHAPYVPPEADLDALGGDREVPSDRYDAEIRFTDRELGRLWDRIRSLGLDDRTLLAVVGDHGEEFGEHGGTDHGRTLYEEVLRVPLFLRYPAALPAGGRLEPPVPLSSLQARLLALLDQGGGAPGDPPAGEGSAEALDFRLDLDGRLLYALRIGRWKYLHAVRPARAEELYDLENDPGELTNLLGERTRERDRLARILDRRLSRSRPGLHIRLSAGAEESRRLIVHLRTPARVGDIQGDMLEEGDLVGLEVEGDLQKLIVDARVEGEETRVEELGRLVPRRFPDVDEVTVRLDPPDSPVEIEVMEGEARTPFREVWLGARPAPARIAFDGEDPGLAVPAVVIEGRPEGSPPVWIHVVPAGSAVTGPVREDIDRRLRALGYVE